MIFRYSPDESWECPNCSNVGSPINFPIRAVESGLYKAMCLECCYESAMVIEIRVVGLRKSVQEETSHE